MSSTRATIIGPPCDILSLPVLELEDEAKREKVLEFMAPLILDDDVIEKIKKVYNEEIELGLAKDPPKKSSLLMENSWITDLPNRTEQGDILALDLGGTNFRVILLRLKDGVIQSQLMEQFHIPEAVRLGHADKLYDFLADCIVDFLTMQSISPTGIPLGFCFSFPIKQEKLNVGVLVKWTKSFNSPGAEGKDAVDLLNQALARKKVKIDVVAILNDTSGTLASGCLLDTDCRIGLIIGTGSNACYMEKVSRIGKWNGPPGVEFTNIVMEWGAFGDKGGIEFLRTQFDEAVDQGSVSPGSFTFEKYISGNYIGETMRHIVLHMCKEGFFGGYASQRLQQFGAFTAAHLSTIEQETLEGTSLRTKEALNDLDLVYEIDDIKALQYVGSVVTFRSAQLVSIGIACLLERIERPRTVCAVDGSVYKYNPRMKALMDHYTGRYAPGKNFQYIMAEDGSGKGAGMVAAIAQRLSGKPPAFASSGGGGGSGGGSARTSAAPSVEPRTSGAEEAPRRSARVSGPATSAAASADCGRADRTFLEPSVGKGCTKRG